MMKQLKTLLCVLFLSASVTGCAAVLIGAGAGGTAYWLSNKLSQTVDASFDRTVKASREALTGMKLTIIRETTKKDVAQYISKWTDGSDIWVDIRPITTKSSKIEVRVGGIKGDKAASEKILEEIHRRL